MDFSNVKKVFLPSRLPFGYQEVEYIENGSTSSTDGQYINTLFTPTANTKVILETEITGVESNAHWAEQGSAQSGHMFCFGCHSGYFVLSINSVDSTQSQSIVYGRKYIYELDAVNTTFKVYDTVAEDYVINREVASYSASSTDNHFYLFRYNGGSSLYCPAKVYSCKIYDNNVLVRDLVPCYRKSDSVIGLYDLVNNTFYTNSGTGTFTKGNDVNTRMEVIKISIPSGEVTHNLPAEYQEVEYIESDGTQWINSGTASQVGHKHTFEGTISITGNNGDRETVWGNDWTDLQQNTLLQYAELGEKATWTYYHSLIDDSTLLQKNGITVASGSYSYNGNATIAIFSSYFYSPMRYSHIKLFELKIYYDNETTPIRHFIPCYRKSDGEIGLYDIINGAFHTKQSGNDFTKGDDIIGEIVLWEKPEQ